MTIKIITKGVDPKLTPLRGTCYNCKTVVECAKGDAKPSDSRDQRDSGLWSLACPVCGVEICMREFTPPPGGLSLRERK